MPSCLQQPGGVLARVGLSQEKASGPAWALACIACLLGAARQKRGRPQTTTLLEESTSKEQRVQTQSRENSSRQGLEQVTVSTVSQHHTPELELYSRFWCLLDYTS